MMRGVAIPSIPDRNLKGSIVQLGLSLPDRGRAPQYVGTLNGVTAGTAFNQFTNTDPITLAHRELGAPFSIFFNAGKSGDTLGAVGAITSGMLQRLNSDVLSLNPLPGVVSLQGFGNDINQINSTADIETVVSACKANFEAIYNAIVATGMDFWIEILPDNGTWTARPERAFAQWRVYRYCLEFARQNNVRLFNYMACASWPDAQLPKTCQALVAVSQVVAAGSNGANIATATTINIDALGSLNATAGFVNIHLSNGNRDVIVAYTGTTGTTLTGCTTTGIGTMSTNDTVRQVQAQVNTHGYAENDSVFSAPDFLPDVAFVLQGAQIHKVDNNNFNYGQNIAPGTATVKGSFIRNNVLPNIMADAPSNVHWAYAGAQKAKYVAVDALSLPYGKRDHLTVTERDAANIVGFGLAGTNNNVINRGMMTGSGGTHTGSATVSGTIPTGIDINDLTGGTGATVTCSLVAYSDPARSHMSFLQLVIAAGTSDLHLQARMAHTLPSAWQSSHAYNVGDWIIPATGWAGYGLCCVIAGTSGNSEPSWGSPTPGLRVADGAGNLKWEWRQGWINDAATQYRLGAEGFIIANAANGLLNQSFGLFDPSSANNSLVDGDDLNPNTSFFGSQAPKLQAGSNWYWDTPNNNSLCIIPTAMTNPTVAARWWVAANQTVTVGTARWTWYKTGLTI